VQLLRHWNLASGARRQIELERRTYLIATTLTLVMALQGFALLLMVFNADAMAPLLIGAMCAFGTFNASVFGFPALFAKMALFFAAIVWLAMNHADVQARDYPLTRRKYALLLLIAPLGLGCGPESGVFCRPQDRHPDLLLRHGVQPRKSRAGR
jgi:hypothetical protein